MSRIGITPITIPREVGLEIRNHLILVKGPKGAVEIKLPNYIKTELQADKLNVLLSSGTNKPNEHGLYRALISNAVLGVLNGWEKTVELVGVGYRASSTDNELTLNVGFTHPVKIIAPKDISFEVVENTKVIVKGIDKKMVGEMAAQIRRVKKPEPYKGKGIRYSGEIIRKKAGKAVKAAGAPA